jgi:hypothetical protein
MISLKSLIGNAIANKVSQKVGQAKNAVVSAGNQFAEDWKA